MRPRVMPAAATAAGARVMPVAVAVGPAVPAVPPVAVTAPAVPAASPGVNVVDKHQTQDHRRDVHQLAHGFPLVIGSLVLVNFVSPQETRSMEKVRPEPARPSTADKNSLAASQGSRPLVPFRTDPPIMAVSFPEPGPAMDHPSYARTNPTLLDRLRRDPANQAAWSEFLQRYAPRIYAWCRRWDLQPADAEEVTQNVLLKLVGKLATFSYDPSRSFRGWLKTLTHHAWVDYLDSVKGRAAGGNGSQAMAVLQSIEARDDLVKRLEEEFDHELLAEAMARVRERVEPQTWEAFRLTSLEGLSGAEAAARIPMKEAMVFIARGRVLKMLRQEIRALEGSQE
jgi:RNA polymerase sigma-70 factor (ECF subfamily)